MRQKQDTSMTLKRAYVLFPSVLLGFVVLYKTWGPLLFITCALVAVCHTCYSLLCKDCLFDRKSLIFIKKIIDFVIEFAITLRILLSYVYLKFDTVIKKLKIWIEQRNNKWKIVPRDEDDEMSARRNSYRLSTSGIDWAEKSNSGLNTGSYNSFALNGACNAAMTSTPISKHVPWKKEPKQNGSIGLFAGMDTPQPKKISLINENRQHNAYYRDDISKNTAWGTNNSPRIKEKGSGIKTVQTVAGPLLASTRYNIDPKVYTDISSPGLTSRLTKYATEANSKLTHQPQYLTGQFPRVNLNATPPPMLSPKVVRSRMPVTVRVAPPEIVNYSPSDSFSHQERHKLFLNTSASESKELKPQSSVAQVLKEMSLKRHASRDDIMTDLVKKQRTDSRMSDGQLESLEEMMQKRARDDSASSEEDLSPQSKMQRPTKRQKASSCHDILNSLSSSMHVISGVKRKAGDMSRCNTPEVDKHFKASSKSSSLSSSSALQSLSEISKSKEQLNIKVPTANTSRESQQVHKSQENVLRIKGDETLSKKLELKIQRSSNEILPPKEKSPIIAKAEKLTDKLFMKPEPQNIDKLKNLMKDQDSIEAKFRAGDKDEIKKQDIVNMRQNSMRQRLQSMFDAISGKTPNKIDPDLVIQAEGINSQDSNSMTSLTSVTTTTTVNTSPIATNIVPILKNDAESKSPTNKHVTFNIQTSDATSQQLITSATSTAITASNNSTFSFGNTAVTKTTAPLTATFNFSSGTVTTANNTNNSTVMSTPKASLTFGNSTTSTTMPISTATEVKSQEVPSKVTFGLTSTAPSTSTQPSFTLGKTESGFSFGASSAVKQTVVPSSSQLSQPQVSATTSSITMFSSSSNAVTSVSNASSSNNQPPPPAFGAQTTSSPMFSAGSNATLTTSNNVNQSAASVFGTSMTSSPMFSAGSNASASTSSLQTTTTAASVLPKTAPIFSFGDANKTAPVSANSSGFSFGSGAQTVNSGISKQSTATTSTTSAVNGTMNQTFGSSSPSVFGGSNVTSSPNLFSNVTSTTNTSMFKSPAATTTSSSIFKTQATTTSSPSIFGAQNNNASFGSTTSAPNTATTTSNLFSSTPKSTTSKQQTITSMFSKSKPSTTSAAPTFGTQTQSGSIFSGNTGTNAVPSSGIFGSTSAPSPSGLFSGAAVTSSSVAPATNQNDTSIFSQTKAPSFGSSTSAFGGSSSNSTTFSAPSTSSTFQIGTSNASNALPSFGSIKPQTTSPAFGGQSSTTPTGSVFGGSGFGSSTANPSFGSTTGSFGATSSTTAFGSNTLAQTTTSAFTLPTTTTASGNSLFGSTPNTVANTFSFGSNQPVQTPQSNSSFSFSGTTSTAPSNSGIFQFGSASSSSKPASTGFNFNAPTGAPTINFTGGAGAPPAFNAPPGNMFSIGSGSTAPRSRTSRSRRQR